MIVIILAAGKGTRMKSSLPKVLHEVAGKPMLSYSIEVAKKLSPDKIIVVVGQGSEQIISFYKDSGVIFCKQKEQLGTADAVKAAISEIEGAKEDDQILILYGDMPNISFDTLKDFVYKSEGAGSVITSRVKNPFGYGRIIKSSNGNIKKIVEERDASDEEKDIKEINTGVYCCRVKILLERLKNIKNDNNQGEYYLTDIVEDFTAWCSSNEEEFFGVNDLVQLSEVSRIIWEKRAKNLMLKGVTILDPYTLYVDENIEVSCDTVIYPNVYIEGNTRIGSKCQIYSGVRINDSEIGNNCTIMDNSLIEGCKIGDSCSIGPMAHLRKDTILLGENRVGNFVEIKNTILGKKSKSAHLTYLGDSEIGENVNIGCGVITCNYDGYNKHKTIIGNNCFIGSDVQLIAPVKIGEDAVIGAGSTITKNVDPGSLSISRSEQINYKNKAYNYKIIKNKR